MSDAVGFPAMLGPLTPGDRVIVNTTGLELGLGTGGVAFVLWNLDGELPEPKLDGHIMKLRYTPWQTEVVTAEAPESPHHGALTSSRIDRWDAGRSLHAALAGCCDRCRDQAATSRRPRGLSDDGRCVPADRVE